MIPELHLQAAASLIAAFEGLAKRVPGAGLVVPYPDPVHGWKVPTVGYGVVCRRDAGPFTPAECVAMLFAKLDREYGRAVVDASPTLAAPWNRWRFAAAASFCWNLGGPNYRASGMRRAIDQADWPAAATNCRLWVLAGGQRLPGLVRRRECEARMLMAACWDAQSNTVEAESRVAELA